MRTEQQLSLSESSAGKPISALHVGKYFPPFMGGMESFLADLLPGLRAAGVEATGVVHHHRASARGVVTTESGIGCHSNSIAAADPTGFRLYRVPTFGRLLYAPVSPGFPSWLRRAIRAERPNILHFHLPNTSAFWALSLSEARRLPWVVHWHADVVSSEIDRRLKMAYPLYRQFEQRLLQRADAIVVSSPPYLDHSPALTPWRHKCHVAPLGLDPARIPELSQHARREAEAAWDGAELRILSVGRLTYYKGHEYLIQALKDVPGARVLIVGEGERRRSLQRLISELGLNERVVLTGSQPMERLHALMDSCHCLCLPSIERTEAFGVVLVEAMAYEKPTVVFDIPGSGVPWVVRNGETGLVVPPADPAALAKALRRLANDADAIARMGRRGWHRYQNMFRMDRVSREIRHLYEEILNQTGG